MRVLRVFATAPHICGCAPFVAALLLSAETSPLSSQQTSIVIGQSGAAGRDFIGEITDALMDDHGRVVLLDRQTQELKVYAENGRRVQTLGRSGAGPGEFASPRTMWRTPNGDIEVLDTELLRVSRFAVGRDSIRFVGSRQLPISAFDACYSGDGLAAMGYHDGRILHLLAAEPALFRVRSSYVEAKAPAPLPPAHPLFAAQTGYGYVACDQASSLVAFGSVQFGELRILKPGDPAVSSFDVPRFARIQFEVRGAEVTQRPAADGSYDRLLPLIFVGRDSLLVQVERLVVDKDGLPSRKFVESHLFRPSSGSWLYLRRSQGMLLALSVSHRLCEMGTDEPSALLLPRGASADWQCP